MPVFPNVAEQGQEKRDGLGSSAGLMAFHKTRLQAIKITARQMMNAWSGAHPGRPAAAASLQAT
jgi:hypothetical protein